MQIVHARIDGQTFALATDTDIDHVKRCIVEAVREGAAFVDIETFGRRVLSILITPATSVRFEVFEVDDDDSEWDHDSSSIENFEMFGYADLES
jgi:hypothetical protein